MNKIYLFTIFLFISFGNKAIAQEFIQGSWGVRLIVSGGTKLNVDAAKNNSTANDNGWVAGAQEIVDNLPSVGHVITNFTHPAHAYLYTLRTNPNVDIANEIHPDFVPSLENEKIILDVINTLKNGGKKVILYLAIDGPPKGEGTAQKDEYEAAWANYYNNSEFNGDEGAAWRDLMKGFAERFKGLADGYWLDHINDCPGGVTSFIDMLKDVDPTVNICANGVEFRVEDLQSYFQYSDGTFMEIETDGLNDPDPTTYKLKTYNFYSPHVEYTAGHPTPMEHGAPPNSWAYEEFTFPEIIAATTHFNPETDIVKHAWVPMRNNWTSTSFPLLFDVEQAYRFVRTLTDANCAITWANAKTNGKIIPEEMEIMKEIDARLRTSPMPDYIPYVRPEGSLLVKDTEKSLYQVIFAPNYSLKTLEDNDFTIGALASSGLPVSTTSSNTSVATIVANKIHIVGTGTTTITYKQTGNSKYAKAVDVTRSLTVVEELSAISPQVVVSSVKEEQKFVINAIPDRTIIPGTLGIFTDNATSYIQLRGTNTLSDDINGKVEFYVQATSGNKKGTIGFDVKTIAGTQATFTVTVEGLTPQVYNVVHTNIDLLTKSGTPYDEFRLDFTNTVNFSMIPTKVSIEINDIDKANATTVTAARFYNFYYTNLDELSVTPIIKNNLTYKISPNPIQNSFTIIKGSNEIIKSLEIFNRRGVLVKSYKDVHNEYNISDLTSGFYLAIVKTENQITVVKLIKE
ncbi:T9SS type A sorting domain-containing protein [Flavicella sediminum]|uniref:T9SS type A sorting domain-containing protein n=1 Tax=Flavicella sediminum TaxID=2585141 RepID=UPI001123D822|nr:T9SS type A sorting domain-containing protein [Flavicella sediminum]